ncbi:MAG: class I SAM-dependent methyltransferase [Candidatus Paceibacterota bacterium]
MINSLLLDEIEQMNRAATDRGAGDLVSLEEGLEVPEADLGLFFRNIPGPKMLDIGCGWGRYVNRFVERDMDYTGIDYSPVMLQQARTANPEQLFVKANYHETGFEDESFDGIWGCCTFSAEPKCRVPEALAELRRILTPEGILFLVLPQSYERREYIGNVNPVLGRMYHSLWEHMEFGQALIDAGFKIMYTTQRFECGSMTFIVQKN